MFPGFALLLAGVVLAVVACAGNDDGTYPRAMPAPLGLCGLGAGLVSVPFFAAAALGTIALGGSAVAARSRRRPRWSSRPPRPRC